MNFPINIMLQGILLGSAMIASLGCEENTEQTSRNETVAPPKEVEPWFEDHTVASGITFVWESGFQGSHQLPQIVGGGAALFDMDNDGDLDCYLVQGGSIDGDPAARPANRLYENDGTGVFTDVTDGSGATDKSFGMGVACADYDGDGYVDIYVTNLGPNTLLRNRGDGTFEDVSQAAGVADSSFGASAAFFDADGDGDLDLFATNYVQWSQARELVCYNDRGHPDYCAPNNYNATAMDVFYRNNGDGTFVNATRDAGFDASFGNGLGVAAGDFNGDGQLDLFVANDGNADQLWINKGDGTFEDMATFFNCAFDSDGKAKAGMGVTVADVDDDRDLDLLVCNLRNETDSFFINEDGKFFIDRTTRVGLGTNSRPFTRFGMGLIDFDHDGLLDLFQANGKVMAYDEGSHGDVYAEKNLLLKGDVDGRFRRVGTSDGLSVSLPRTSRAATFGDIDNDGAIDIVVVNRDASAIVMRNVRCDETSGAWLSVDVRDSNGAPALHAVVTARIGERTLTREVRAAYSYLASNDPRVHMGLGDATTVDELVIRWPDGHTRTLEGVKVNQHLQIAR